MMNRLSINSLRLPAICLLAATASLPTQAAETKSAARNPAYQQECSACHLAYPPQFLSAVSWHAVMGGLAKHFGSDASIEPAIHAEILRYLEANAGRRDTSAVGSAAGKPQLRISETRWFVHEHSEELPRNIWKNPAVKSPANCMACHTVADQGDYSERTLRLPKGVKK